MILQSDHSTRHYTGLDTMLGEDVAGLGTWQSASRKAKREA